MLTFGVYGRGWVGVHLRLQLLGLQLHGLDALLLGLFLLARSAITQGQAPHVGTTTLMLSCPACVRSCGRAERSAHAPFCVALCSNVLQARVLLGLP